MRRLPDYSLQVYCLGIFYACASLGCATGGILVNNAFSTSGVATLDTTISRMTAVK